MGSAVEAPHRFSEIYNRCGVSTREVRSAAFATSIPALFPVFAASDLMAWPRTEELGAEPELWALTPEAVREIQDLGGHGQNVTTGQSLIEMWKAWEA